MNTNVLVNADNNGILQVLAPLDDRLFEQGYRQLEIFREQGINPQQMTEF